MAATVRCILKSPTSDDHVGEALLLAKPGGQGSDRYLGKTLPC